MISLVENCTYYGDYIKLLKYFNETFPKEIENYGSYMKNSNELYLISCDSVKQFVTEKNLFLKQFNIVNNTMASFLLEYKGNYSHCEWDGVYHGAVTAYNYGEWTIRDEWTVYANCDNVREQVVLFLEENSNMSDSVNIKKAYFSNGNNDFYQQIYPENVMIKERNPLWEKPKLSFGMTIVIIIILAIILLLTYFFMKYKHYN
jgi:hypothetical protein